MAEKLMHVVQYSGYGGASELKTDCLMPLILSPKRQNLEYLVKLVREGKLKTVIESKHPLRKAEDAWAKSIDGHATGKIIVEL